MTLREKIKSGKKIIGMHINFNDVAVGRIAGLAGYDFVWLDLEHGNMTFDNVLANIVAIQAGGTAVIVRVPQDDLTYTKKVLEMGPDGIIFPMIRSAKQANEVISWTLYPPYGTRGFGPQNAVKYGFDSAQEYVDDTINNVCRFIQIEHIDAINDLDEIMKNQFIDGYIYGPNDLSGSINMLGHVFSPEVTKLIKDTTDKLHANGKFVGLSTGDTSDATLTHWSNMGVDMLSAGADFCWLQECAYKNRINMEKIHKEQ